MFDLTVLGGRTAFDDLVLEVLRAGQLALTLFREGAGERAQKKPDRSPVTEADRRVEEALSSFIRRRFPNASFLGEETGGEQRHVSGLRFIVDPIDGTRAFTRGLPSWSILVGVEHEGVPVAGIAHLPAAGDLFVAVQGHGAYDNGRPIRLSGVSALEDALVCHGGLSQFVDDGREDLLGRLARTTYTQRGLADFASYAALLRGQADAVIDPAIQPYDVAPACVMVREAGGRFTSLDGVDTIDGPGALASNGLVHAALLEVVRGDAA